jgi:hypothetical protein
MNLAHSKLVVVVMFLGLAVAAPVQATTWHVDDDQVTLGTDGTSWATAFKFRAIVKFR